MKLSDIRPHISWSEISTWEWNPGDWYDSYILGNRKTSKQMTFGSMVDKKLQEERDFLPQVERYPISQHPLEFYLDSLKVVGYIDGYDPATPRIKDDKTGVSPWTQKKADETGQLTLYTLGLHLQDGVNPADLRLSISWLPTKENGDFSIGFRDNPVTPIIFHTKRTKKDIMLFGAYILETRKKMEEYVIHKAKTQ